MTYMEDETIPKILIDFLNYNANLNKSQNTMKEYRYDLNNFLKYMKALKLKVKLETIHSIADIDVKFIETIELNDIYAYMSYLKDTCHNQAAARARKIASIKSFFKYLHQKIKVIPDNPTKELERPKIEKRLPKYLTLEESEKLLNTIKSRPITTHEHDNKERDYAIVVLFLNCGMRLSELVGINIKDIKFDDSILTVIGKGNKERTVYLNKACMDAIEDYRRVRPIDRVIDKDALFLSERRKRIGKRTVQSIIDKYLREIGLGQYSTHKLRHTAATLMYQYGNVDIRALQEILGHESIATTEIYTHTDNAHIRQAVENNPLANYKPKS